MASNSYENSLPTDDPKQLEFSQGNVINKKVSLVWKMLVRAVIIYSILCMQLWMTTILSTGVGLAEKRKRARDGSDYAVVGTKRKESFKKERILYRTNSTIRQHEHVNTKQDQANIKKELHDRSVFSESPFQHKYNVKRTFSILPPDKYKKIISSLRRGWAATPLQLAHREPSVSNKAHADTQTQLGKTAGNQRGGLAQQSGTTSTLVKPDPTAELRKIVLNQDGTRQDGLESPEPYRFENVGKPYGDPDSYQTIGDGIYLASNEGNLKIANTPTELSRAATSSMKPTVSGTKLPKQGGTAQRMNNGDSSPEDDDEVEFREVDGIAQSASNSFGPEDIEAMSPVEEKLVDKIQDSLINADTHMTVTQLRKSSLNERTASMLTQMNQDNMENILSSVKSHEKHFIKSNPFIMDSKKLLESLKTRDGADLKRSLPSIESETNQVEQIYDSLVKEDQKFLGDSKHIAENVTKKTFLYSGDVHNSSNTKNSAGDDSLGPVKNKISRSKESEKGERNTSLPGQSPTTFLDKFSGLSQDSVIYTDDDIKALGVQANSEGHSASYRTPLKLKGIKRGYTHKGHIHLSASPPRGKKIEKSLHKLERAADTSFFPNDNLFRSSHRHRRHKHVSRPRENTTSTNDFDIPSAKVSIESSKKVSNLTVTGSSLSTASSKVVGNQLEISMPVFASKKDVKQEMSTGNNADTVIRSGYKKKKSDATQNDLLKRQRKLQPDISVDNSETYSEASIASALHNNSSSKTEGEDDGRSNTDSWNVTVRAEQRQVLPKPAVNTVDDDIDPTIMPIDPTANSKGKKGDFPNDSGLSGQNQVDDSDSQGDDSVGDPMNSSTSLVADNPDSYELDPPVKTNDLQKAIQDQDLRGLEDLKDTLGSEYKSTLSYFESPDAQQQHAEGKTDESNARIEDKFPPKVVPSSKFIHTHSGNDRLKIVVDVPTNNGVNDSLKEREESSSMVTGKDNTEFKPSKWSVNKRPKISHPPIGSKAAMKGTMAENSWPLTVQSSSSKIPGEKQASGRFGHKSSNGYMSENGKVMVPPSYNHPPPDTSVVLPDDPDSIDNEDISVPKIPSTFNNDREPNKKKYNQKNQESMKYTELDVNDEVNSDIKPTPSPYDHTANYKDHKKQGSVEAKFKGNAKPSGLEEASNTSVKVDLKDTKGSRFNANKPQENGVDSLANLDDNGKQTTDQESTAFEAKVSNSFNALNTNGKAIQSLLDKDSQEESAIPILKDTNAASLTPAINKEESPLRYSFKFLPTMSSLEFMKPQKGLSSEAKTLKASQSFMSTGLGESVGGEGGKMNEGNAVELLGPVTSVPSRRSSDPTHATVTIRASQSTTKDLTPSVQKGSKGSEKPNVNYLDNAYVLGNTNVSRDLVIRPNRREENVSNARFLSIIKDKDTSAVSTVNSKKERSSKSSRNKTVTHQLDHQQLRIKGGKINGGIVRGGLIMGGYVDGGDIEGGSILGGKVEGGLFKSGVMENGILYNGTVEGGVIRGGKILGGEIISGIIEGGVMKGGLLEGGHLRGGYLEGGTFKGGDMEGGTLKAGEMSGGILKNGSVDGGIFKGGIIEGGHLLGGVMLGGRLKGGIVKSGLIRGGVIEGGVIEGGVIDEGTVIKGGIYKGNKGNDTEMPGSGRSKVAYSYGYKDLQVRDLTGEGLNNTNPPADNNNILGAPESWPFKTKQGPRLEHPSHGKSPMGSPRDTGANFFPRQIKFPEPKPLFWNHKVKSKASLSKKSVRNFQSKLPSLKFEVKTSDDKPVVKNATSDIRELLLGLEKNIVKQKGKDATRFNIPKESYKASVIKWPLPSGLQLLAHHFTSKNPVSPYGRSQVSGASNKVSSTAVFPEPYSHLAKVGSFSVKHPPFKPGKNSSKSTHLHQLKEQASASKLPENTMKHGRSLQKGGLKNLEESSLKVNDAKRRKKGNSRSVVTLNDEKESNWYEVLGPNGEHYETLGNDITSNTTQNPSPKQDASASITQSDNSYQSDATAQEQFSHNVADSDQTHYDNQKGYDAYQSANDNSTVYKEKQDDQYSTINNQDDNTVQPYSNTNNEVMAQPIRYPTYQQQDPSGASATYPASNGASTTTQLANSQQSAIDWDYNDKSISKANVFEQNGRDEMLQKEETEHDYDERRSELIPTLHWSLNKLVSERIPGDPGNPIRISGNVTIHNGIAVLAKGYLDAGDYAGECISDPEVCSDGLTVSMTIKLYKDAVASNSPMYIFDSGASSNDSRGIAMWVKGYSIYASLATRFYTWCLDEKLDQFVEKWVAFVLTWRENVGMKLYTNCQLFATSEYGGQCDVCTNCHKVDKNTRLMFGRPNKGPHFRVTHFACGDISIYNHYFDEKEVVMLCGTNNDNGRVEESSSVQKPNQNALKVRHYPAIHNRMYWPTPPHYASLLDTAQNVAEAINVEPTATTPTTTFQARFRLSRPTEFHYYSVGTKTFSTDQPIISHATNEHPVHGGYSPWSEWSRCTKSCAGGFQFSLRYCNNPMPRHGGADCRSLGPSRQTKACNERGCFIDPDLDFPSTDVPAIGIEPYRGDKRKKSGISQDVQSGKSDGIEKALEFLKM